MNNIPEILKSKRFWVLVGTIVAAIVVVLVPELQSAELQLITVIGAMGLATSLGYSIQDWIRTVYFPLKDLVEATKTPVDDELLAAAAMLIKLRFPDLNLETAPVSQVNVNVDAVPDVPEKEVASGSSAPLG